MFALPGVIIPIAIGTGMGCCENAYAEINKQKIRVSIRIFIFKIWVNT
jgi:hypothetical protein